MNRQANIQIALLIPLALAFMIIAWMTYFSADRDLGARSLEFSSLTAGIGFNQQYITSEARLIVNDIANSGVSDSELKNKFMEIASSHKIGIENEGNFYAKVRNGEFTFVKQGADYIFEIKELNIKSKAGDNEIKRSFNLKVIVSQKVYK